MTRTRHKKRARLCASSGPAQRHSPAREGCLDQNSAGREGRRAHKRWTESPMPSSRSALRPGANPPAGRSLKHCFFASDTLAGVGRNPDTSTVPGSGFRVRAFSAPRNDEERKRPGLESNQAGRPCMASASPLRHRAGCSNKMSPLLQGVRRQRMRGAVNAGLVDIMRTPSYTLSSRGAPTGANPESRNGHRACVWIPGRAYFTPSRDDGRVRSACAPA